MERTFLERIEAESRRGEIDSPAAEETAMLESWMRQGVATPGTPAQRFGDTVLAP